MWHGDDGATTTRSRHSVELVVPCAEIELMRFSLADGAVQAKQGASGSGQRGGYAADGESYYLS